MAKRTLKSAATNLRQALDTADAGGYGINGWYFYLDRMDVEMVVAHALKPPPKRRPARKVKT